MLRHIRIRDLQVSFNGEDILDHLSLEITPGEMYAIIGPNGAGKSTLLKSILGLVRPQRGEIDIAGEQKKVVVGYVPQSRTIDDEMPISARDFVSLGQMSRIWPWPSRQEKKMLQEMMQFTDTYRFAGKPIGKLSGGERQRVFLAQALVRQPDLLLLDESTANLDPDAEVHMMELVTKAVREWGVTVLFICHDLRMVRTYADRVLLLSRGHYTVGDVASILDDRELLEKAFQSQATAKSGRQGQSTPEAPVPLSARE